MPRAYSVDMRERVIARSSGALRREAAEHVTISAPNAETGRCAVKAVGVGALSVGGTCGLFAGANCEGIRN